MPLTTSKKYIGIIAILTTALISVSFKYGVEMQSTNNCLYSDTASYLNLKANIKFKQDSISKIYSLATNTNKKEHLKNTEKLLLETYYKTLIPQWLGTKWDFYGETQFPRDSSIACGHFVVTTLKHLGFTLGNSHEMATNYSAYMVNSLCDTSFKVHKAAELLKIVETYPDDVWVVGLRSHSGLLIKYKGKIRFVHSCATDLSMVVDEPIEESMTFQGSNIFVSGPLFKNNSLTEKWILGKEVEYTKKY